MSKKHLHQYMIGAIVGFSILSFVYVNFFAGMTSREISRNQLQNTSQQSTEVDRDDVDNEKGGGPDIAVFVRIFEIAKNFVPSSR